MDQEKGVRLRSREDLVIRRRWVSPSLTMGRPSGRPIVHADTPRVPLHRPLRDAEHDEDQAGPAELDTGRSAAKSHPTVRDKIFSMSSWLYLPALALPSACEHHKHTGWPRRVGVGPVHRGRASLQDTPPSLGGEGRSEARRLGTVS